MDDVNMEKSVKDNPEYKMKRQGMIIGLVCLAVMVFLTIFLMSSRIPILHKWIVPLFVTDSCRCIMPRINICFIWKGI